MADSKNLYDVEWNETGINRQETGMTMDEVESKLINNKIDPENVIISVR